jgi:hypothetical protein
MMTSPSPSGRADSSAGASVGAASSVAASNT